MNRAKFVVYSPASPLRNPGLLFREMFHDLSVSRELAWRLFVRDISAQYRQSILGFAWVFIPPLVASLPFIYLNSQGVTNFGATAIPYAAYAVIGTILWQVFVDALNAPLRTVIAARPVLTRINLPREAVLLSAFMSVLFSAVVRLPLLVGVMIWFGLTPPLTALMFPIALLGLILTGFVFGLLLVPLGMLYNDVTQALPVATTFLMLLTPVVYPAPKSGLAQLIATYNPLTPIIAATRDWLTVGPSSYGGAFAAIMLAAIVLLFVGWLSLRIAMPHIIARAGT